jgi:antirestriction protein
MPVHCGEIPENQRASFAAKLFGARFIFLESFVFDTASSLSPDYDGGLWAFNGLCNGGFDMVPTGPKEFRVQCANGFDGVLSAEAFGITCCLYAYSLLSFSPDEDFSALCAEHFHRLRAYMLDHAESAAIQRAID